MASVITAIFTLPAPAAGLVTPTLGPPVRKSHTPPVQRFGNTANGRFDARRWAKLARVIVARLPKFPPTAAALSRKGALLC
jgi:hypothetical protein